METHAYFNNIHEHILKELTQAIFNIAAAIAWLTDKDIYDLLCGKTAQNVRVSVFIESF